MAKAPYLECGKIINTHGFRGDVKLESWCDSPEILASLPRVYLRSGNGFAEKKVLHASVFKQFVIAGLEGIGSDVEADKLRGTVLFAAREDLPTSEGSYFVADLIGLPVLDADSGEKIGELVDVDTSGFRDLYRVRTGTGDYLVPAVPEFIISIDDEAVRIRPIPGLLDGGEEN